ncbi:MAG: bifunctional 23S rRNA (guanine(2069)-N(7))-methyltransferase RlmK/23S rRNA (guanine(2445)-N(2))-methyltransferase RlmL [Proteobacteria bacterium]|nr:bifunctional 23S rRNA (guanine(2069)-N(7))-methyltransferase RlmK/23S rRNA (guanine(2445)-N(2))-methyltransferase RlmL [Pseudomonadota bacterium]MBU1641322.1 bifunctional 23S rRNA (guanine(2069)-N(7))-methyltransferase RlmK/23S rRNA (guanine(2445)-N(2))-methyltransferase RlmL [Pseudomonadota bacterium]
MADLLQLTATCSAGLEELVASEIRSFGGQDLEILTGAVTFQGNLPVAYRCCLWSRFTSRILLSLSRFPAPDTDALYEGVKAVAWNDHMHAENTLSVDCVLSDSQINHSHFAALRVKDAVVDYFRDMVGERPSVDSKQPDIRLNVFIRQDEAYLSLDLAGDSLHRRGYRQDGGQAPLKESLAAAIVTRAGVTPGMGRDDVILDPLCGSGTLLVEAALIIGDVAPGLDRRHFGFLKWRGHQRLIWQDLVDEAMAREEAGSERPWPRLLGFDSDPSVVKAALANIDRAGFRGKIHVERRDLARLQPPENLGNGRHLLVTNPPYGERLSDKEEVKYLYRCLGRIAASAFNRWQLAVFCSNPDLLDALAQKTIGQYRFYNGAIPCTLRLFEVAGHPDRQVSWQIHNDALSSTLANRLKKNLKPLLKWADREKITCLRIYDRDIPEYNVAIDLYGPWVHIQEYAAPDTVDADKVRIRRKEIIDTVSELLDCKRNRIFVKTREKQKGKKQYEKQGAKGRLVEVEEGGGHFLVNLSDYLDAGLFLDHRPLRATIQALAKGTRFLNLYCYTGSATVHAAMGGARTTTSVDTSKTYLDWARKNLCINGLDPERHRLERCDCLEWLQGRKVERYDLIFIDPPTFSNTKKGGGKVFDIQRDHGQLIEAAMALLESDGLLLFSTNSRKFKLDEVLAERFAIHDISAKTIPLDFGRNKKIHRAFEIRHRANVAPGDIE